MWLLKDSSYQVIFDELTGLYNALVSTREPELKGIANDIMVIRDKLESSVLETREWGYGGSTHYEAVE